jgi:hypothetical protein
VKKLALIFSLVLIWTRSSHAELTSVGLDKTSYTSDFMIGSVVVSVIFPESSGASDPNTETWSDERKSQCLSQIMAGLDWWTHLNPRSPLSFTVVSQTVPTRYEPISRPYYDESLWIPDMMSQLGYSGSRFTSTRDYINALRQQYHTDWGYVIFVVDSYNDYDGKFADGMFGYAYLGGPYMVLTYDDNGYGISNMSVVAAHETGHIFHALDEYNGASSPSEYSSGYFPTINGNHENSSAANDPDSVMRGGIRWSLDSWAKEMVGWRDSNNNGRDDILDASPTTTLTQQTSSSDLAFSGQASIAVLPRQDNAQGYGLTVDTVKNVEYRVQTGAWKSATAADGAYDSSVEGFQIDFPSSDSSVQNVTAQDVQVRVTTAFSSYSGGVTSSSGGEGSLGDVHPYPNPFKPNSNLGHTDVQFANVTPGTKIQIFSVGGDPIFKKEVPAGENTLHWNAVNDQGQAVASGVYFYLITNPNGDKKDGKIAVIR